LQVRAGEQAQSGRHREGGAEGCSQGKGARCQASRAGGQAREAGGPHAPRAALLRNGGARKWGVRRSLVAGVLVWLPILATIWVVSFMLHIMDRTLLLLPSAYRPQALGGFALPGAGLA